MKNETTHTCTLLEDHGGGDVLQDVDPGHSGTGETPTTAFGSEEGVRQGG